MRYVEVGGVRVSVIGLGTWQFGSAEWGYGENYAQWEALRIAERALELGINLIDTAEVYGNGRSELIVGAATRGREAFLATKLFSFWPVPQVIERRALASAGRLQTEAIDLYQLHWPTFHVPLDITMQGLRRVQQTGLVRQVGVSNFSLRRWQAAERRLGAPLLSNQVQYNLASRAAERDLIPYAASHDRVVIAYSPLAQGFLTGNYASGARPGGLRDWNPVNPLSWRGNRRRAAGLVEALRRVAGAHGASPAQVALAWVIRYDNVAAIPGARTLAQLEENAAAADLVLTEEELARLEEASQGFRPAPRALALLQMRRLGRS